MANSYTSGRYQVLRKLGERGSKVLTYLGTFDSPVDAAVAFARAGGGGEAPPSDEEGEEAATSEPKSEPRKRSRVPPAGVPKQGTVRWLVVRAMHAACAPGSSTSRDELLRPVIPRNHPWERTHTGFDALGVWD